MDHLNGVGPQALNGKYHCTADLLPSFCLELAALLKLNEQPFYLFGQIQTSQTGGHPYSDTSHSVSVPSLFDPFCFVSDFWREIICKDRLMPGRHRRSPSHSDENSMASHDGKLVRFIK